LRATSVLIRVLGACKVHAKNKLCEVSMRSKALYIYLLCMANRWRGGRRLSHPPRSTSAFHANRYTSFKKKNFNPRLCFVQVGNSNDPNINYYDITNKSSNTLWGWNQIQENWDSLPNLQMCYFWRRNYGCKSG